jgi:hypothetical protein
MQHHLRSIQLFDIVQKGVQYCLIWTFDSCSILFDSNIRTQRDGVECIRVSGLGRGSFVGGPYAWMRLAYNLLKHS